MLVRLWRESVDRKRVGFNSADVSLPLSMTEGKGFVFHEKMPIFSWLSRNWNYISLSDSALLANEYGKAHG